MTTKNSTPMIAWIDVETTGLDPKEKSLLQVACLVTDINLKILDNKGFEAYVYADEKQTVSLKQEADPYVQEMHTKTGLWGKLSEGITLKEIDHQFLKYLKTFVQEPKQIWLGGNSIFLDRQFINYFLPTTADHLFYRSVDATSWAGPINWWFKYEHKKRAEHDAFSDIRESIEEMQDYKSRVSFNLK